MNKSVPDRRLYRELKFDSSNLPGPLIRRCQQRAEDLYVATAGPGAPTPRQLAIMIALHQEPGSSVAELAQATGVDRNTIGEMIGRLLKKRLVARRRSKSDGRAWVLDLTETGETVVYDNYPNAVAVQEKILAPLPTNLRVSFMQALRILAGLAPDA